MKRGTTLQNHHSLLCVLLSFHLSFAFHTIEAQKHNHNWYFGFNAGIDFNISPPRVVQGEMVALEGCASVSDPEGKLLFYTNGQTVWDRNHQIMPNGTGLDGHLNPGQGPVVVPFPLSQSKYLVFTNNGTFSESRINYSVIDLNLNNGFGDIVPATKNILLLENATESLTTALHDNKVNVWLITHLSGSDIFLCFEITPDGINSTPVSSQAGAVFPGFVVPSALRISNSGLKLVSTQNLPETLELLDFNPITGTVSNSVDYTFLLPKGTSPYSAEFSPNDSLLYVSKRDRPSALFQIDLQTSEIVTLATKKQDIYGTVQSGPDQKVYISSFSYPYIGVIQQPNKKGTDCQFVDVGIELKDGTKSGDGLPQKILYSFRRDTSYYFSLGPDVYNCTAQKIILSPEINEQCDSITYLWSDGSVQPSNSISVSGLFWVEVTSTCGQYRDSIQIEFLECAPIVTYDLNLCRSYMSDGSHMDFSEFAPRDGVKPDGIHVTASNVYRETPNKHSCTPGIDDTRGMCIESSSSCNFAPDTGSPLMFDVEVQPENGRQLILTGLSFYHKSPDAYEWIDGGTGINNPPQFFGLRVLKNGEEIYREESIPASSVWTQIEFDFTGYDQFAIHDDADIQFQLLPYCPEMSGGTVSVWDIDQIEVYGAGADFIQHSVVIGEVRTANNTLIPGVRLNASLKEQSGHVLQDVTGPDGEYFLHQLLPTTSYIISGYKNDDILNGISTEDIIAIQRHLLGIEPFEELHQFVAADINNNHVVNVHDIKELRKLVLGKSNRFPNNRSWRFGVLPYSTQHTDLDKFKEKIVCETGIGDTIQQDFMGIKIGDLTGDVRLRKARSADRRFDHTAISLTASLPPIGQKNFYPVIIQENANVRGIQIAFFGDNTEDIYFVEKELTIEEENIHEENGILKLSWSSPVGHRLSAGDTLFFIANRHNTPIHDLHIAPVPGYASELYMDDKNRREIDFSISDNILENKNEFSLNPTITSGEISIEFIQEREGIVEVYISDLTGRILFEYEESVTEGSQQLVFNLKEEINSSGMYHLTLKTKTDTHSVKFFLTD